MSVVLLCAEETLLLKVVTHSSCTSPLFVCDGQTLEKLWLLWESVFCESASVVYRRKCWNTHSLAYVVVIHSVTWCEVDQSSTRGVSDEVRMDDRLESIGLLEGILVLHVSSEV